MAPPLHCQLQDDEYMFVGQSRFNPQVFGWAGHKEGGGHFTTEGKHVS